MISDWCNNDEWAESNAHVYSFNGKIDFADFTYSHYSAERLSTLANFHLIYKNKLGTLSSERSFRWRHLLHKHNETQFYPGSCFVCWLCTENEMFTQSMHMSTVEEWLHRRTMFTLRIPLNFFVSSISDRKTFELPKSYFIPIQLRPLRVWSLRANLTHSFPKPKRELIFIFPLRQFAEIQKVRQPTMNHLTTKPIFVTRAH